ncbi:MAG: type II toxin-antitoxin system HigB family toxin [Moraxellaceae bacterium]|nr:type II toxin-antitoxin system HigB family toxin [Moraxellaceae bacterium]
MIDIGGEQFTTDCLYRIPFVITRVFVKHIVTHAEYDNRVKNMLRGRLMSFSTIKAQSEPYLMKPFF